MSSRNNAIEAALIEAASIRNRIYVFADGQGDDGFFAVNEEECDPSEFRDALGFAEYNSKRKSCDWVIM